MKVFLLRTWTDADKRQLWVVFDQVGERVVRGRSKMGALALWIQKHGRIESYTRFAGIMRPSEAAITIASLRPTAKKDAQVAS